MVSWSCGIEAEIFGSLTMLASGVLVEKKAKEVYEKNKKDMLFNGLINIASINYLKMCEFVFDSLTSGAEVTFFSSLTIYGLLCFLVGYFILCSYIMIKTDNEDLLDKTKVDKIGNFYTNLKLNKKRGWKSKIVYSVFLAERFIFIFIAYSMRNKFFLIQMAGLIYLKIAVLSYYLHVKPFNAPRWVVSLKFFAEYLHLVVFTFTLCFSLIVLDPATRFTMGWVVIFLIGANILVNFFIIVYEVLKGQNKLWEKIKALKKRFCCKPKVKQVLPTAEKEAEASEDNVVDLEQVFDATKESPAFNRSFSAGGPIHAVSFREKEVEMSDREVSFGAAESETEVKIAVNNVLLDESDQVEEETVE